MTKLDIKIYPDPVLREQAEEVSNISSELRSLLDDMAETMYQAPGIGLAATQVGELVRAIVVDVGDDEETGRTAKLYKLINPVITLSEGKIETEEGCLSIPDVRELVTRAAAVQVQAIDPDGKELRIEAEGILAVCLQHEIDHLNGVLFIDHLSRLKRQMLKNKLKRLTKN